MSKSKKFCEDCRNLPEGEVVTGHDHSNDYDVFVRQGRAAMFTDDQIDFLVDWLNISDGSDALSNPNQGRQNWDELVRSGAEAAEVLKEIEERDEPIIQP